METAEDTVAYTVRQVSWHPRAYVIENFLSDEECDHLIAESEHKLQAAKVVDDKTGGQMFHAARTSSMSSLGYNHDPVVTRIENRVAAITMLPRENQEPLQLLHYVNGQKYEAHHDYFTDEFNPAEKHGGQRIATVLMYLATPDEGGETVFPLAGPKPMGPSFSECSKKGLAIKAAKGSALLFWNLKPTLALDPTSLHESCPTIKGTKWTATKWIRAGEYDHVTDIPLSSCINLKDDRSCQYWASIGECDTKREYMHRNCAASCEVCHLKAARDGNDPHEVQYLGSARQRHRFDQGVELTHQLES